MLCNDISTYWNTTMEDILFQIVHCVTINWISRQYKLLPAISAWSIRTNVNASQKREANTFNSLRLINLKHPLFFCRLGRSTRECSRMTEDNTMNYAVKINLICHCYDRYNACVTQREFINLDKLCLSSNTWYKIIINWQLVHGLRVEIHMDNGVKCFDINLCMTFINLKYAGEVCMRTQTSLWFIRGSISHIARIRLKTQ